MTPRNPNLLLFGRLQHLLRLARVSRIILLFGGGAIRSLTLFSRDVREQ